MSILDILYLLTLIKEEQQGLSQLKGRKLCKGGRIG